MIKTIKQAYRFLATLRAIQFEDYVAVNHPNIHVSKIDYQRLMTKDMEFTVVVNYEDLTIKALNSYGIEIESTGFSEEMSDLIRAGLTDIAQDIKDSDPETLFKNFAKLVKD